MIMLVKEVADVLGGHGDLLCRPSVEMDGNYRLMLTVAILPEQQEPSLAGGLSVVAELYHELRYALDVAQMRAFASRYGIDPAALEALLPKEKAE